MKGLLIKDFKLVKNQRTFVLIVAAICILFSFRSTEAETIISYAAAMLSILVANTISYDEFDNGMGYLFTLPISRMDYVLEKYVFGMILAASIAIIGYVGTMFTSVIRSAAFDHRQSVVILLSALLPSILMQSITIPIQIKFGAEKSRNAYAAMMGIVLIACYGISQIAKAMNIDLTTLFNPFIEASFVQVIGITLLLSFGLLVVSYAISLASMKKKQF